MPATITTSQVWQEIEKRFFAVLALVTARGEPRTAGIDYTVRGREVHIPTGRGTWKVRHILTTRSRPRPGSGLTLAPHVPIRHPNKSCATDS